VIRRALIRRATTSLVLAAVAVTVVLLLLSDRAPGVYRRLVDRTFGVAADVRDRIGLPDLVARSDIPFAATDLGHVVLFGAVTVVAGVVFRHRARPWLVATVVFAASAAFEALQPLVTDSRSQQVADLQANAVGVLAGFLVLSVVVRNRRLRRSRSLAW
jgi:hypothetical protein